VRNIGQRIEWKTRMLEWLLPQLAGEAGDREQFLALWDAAIDQAYLEGQEDSAELVRMLADGHGGRELAVAANATTSARLRATRSAVALCGQVTESQRAYARIITDEVHRTGDCRLTLDEIAARGGMCRKTAKRAQDRLAELGWIKVHQRPVQGRKHLANVVVVVSAEWVTWIKMGPKRRPSSIGGHECPTTVNQSNHTDRFERVDRSQGAFERERGARTEPPDRERRG